MKPPEVTVTRRVVITGIGPVTSAGIGKEAFFESLWKRRCAAVQVPGGFTRTHSLQSKWYVPLPKVSLPEYQLQVQYDSILQAEDRMAILAAKLALEDAGYAIVSHQGRLRTEGLAEASVIIGTGLSGLQTALESFLCHCLPAHDFEAISPGRRLSFSRMVIPKTMPNSPAAWTSIVFNLLGSSHTINASCASGTYAIGEAFRRIKDGYDPVVLTGGVECLHDPYGAIMRGFDALGALTQSHDGHPRPFGQQHSGFLFAEGGASLMVVEDLEHARRRQARIYAEIVDYRANSDACNIVQLEPEGKQIIRLLGELSANRKVDYLNAHGTGTVANDAVEAQAIQTAFGDSATQPFINSTKGILGHTFGASGAIEAAVTALSIARDTIHGNLTTEPLPNLNLPLETVSVPVEQALSVSYGFGGHNAGLLFQKCRES